MGNRKKNKSNVYKEANEAFLAEKAKEESVVVLESGVPWFGTSYLYIRGKDTTMTIFMHPDTDTSSQIIMREAETYKTGMAAIGVPAVRISVSSDEIFEVPEGTGWRGTSSGTVQSVTASRHILRGCGLAT